MRIDSLPTIMTTASMQPAADPSGVAEVRVRSARTTDVVSREAALVAFRQASRARFRVPFRVPFLAPSRAPFPTPFIPFLIPFLFAAALAACGTVPETGRRQFVVLSAAEESRLGEEAYAEALKGAKTITAGPDFERVQRVGARIAAASERRYPAATGGFDWQFALVDVPEVNAWMLPGGKSAVNLGLLRLAATDDELAIVMGHEAAHAIARHGAERISRGMATQVILGAAAASGRVDPAVVEATAVAYGALGETAFSRGEENEADRIGLLIAAEAGYEPRAALTFWRKMSAAGGAKPPEFLSTHPSDERRAQRLEALIPEADAVARAARERGVAQ